MTRLTELEPRWIGLTLDGSDARFGVTFKCPHCDTRIGALFKPFMDPENITAKMAWAMPGAPDMNTGAQREAKWWHRVSGETFDTLTLSPSIDCAGHWHGFITNGQIT